MKSSPTQSDDKFGQKCRFNFQNQQKSKNSNWIYGLSNTRITDLIRVVSFDQSWTHYSSITIKNSPRALIFGWKLMKNVISCQCKGQIVLVLVLLNSPFLEYAGMILREPDYIQYKNLDLTFPKNHLAGKVRLVTILGRSDSSYNDWFMRIRYLGTTVSITSSLI